ncbi:MAG: arsenate reductase family protein [Cyclobacteriaceae bacterium]
MFNLHENEITFFYHPNRNDDRKALAYAESIGNYHVKKIDLTTNKLTETQIGVIADMLKVEIHELVDRSHPSYKTLDLDSNDNPAYDKEDIMTLLKNIPELITTPIAIIGKKGYRWKSADEMAKFCLEHFTTHFERAKSNI